MNNTLSKRATTYSILVLVMLISSLMVHKSACAAYEIVNIDAGTQRDFVVGPGKQEITLDPGQTVTVNMTVANRLGVKKTFSIDMEDISGSRDLDRPAVLLDNAVGPYSLKSYLHIPEYSVTLENGQRATVPVTITVPNDSEPGGLYGSVVVGVVSDPTAQDLESGRSSGANQLITRIGTLFFVRINGDVNEDGKVSDFYLKGNQKVLTSGPVTFDILYDNKGNVHQNPVGNIHVSNIFGADVGVIEVDPWFALPNSLRLREVVWDAPFLMGRYVATANIYPGYGEATSTLSVVFWVLPWKIILSILVALIVIIFGLRLLFSKVSIKIKR